VSSTRTLLTSGSRSKECAGGLEDAGHCDRLDSKQVECWRSRIKRVESADALLILILLISAETGRIEDMNALRIHGHDFAIWWKERGDWHLPLQFQFGYTAEQKFSSTIASDPVS
jgi:hypothetical protein